MKQVSITTTNDETTTFIGEYQRAMEKPNWHYYRMEDGTLLHFRKEHMILVEEREIYE